MPFRLKIALFTQNYFSVHIRKSIAKIFGYFWAPCPGCNDYFAGYESGFFSGWANVTELPVNKVDQENFIPKKERSQCLCPACTVNQRCEVREKAARMLEANNVSTSEISLLLPITREYIDYMLDRDG